MKVVYIAGPFRGRGDVEVEGNVCEARAVGFRVARHGGVPLIPHSMYEAFDGELTDQFWLDATMHLMGRCDAVVLCDGWHRSQGSIAEVGAAQALCLPVFCRYDVSDGLRSWGDFKAWLHCES
jgi:nucleoside 2-deoxyribosyltransferase